MVLRYKNRITSFASRTLAVKEISSYWYLLVATGSFLKFRNQKSPRWVYVNFNWLARLKEVACTKRNNTIFWWELNMYKRLTKRWNSMWKYCSPAMNRTPVVLMLSYIMWEYGGFPFRMLVRIFLAITFVNSESYKKSLTFILGGKLMNKKKWALPEKNRREMWNSASLFRIRFFCRFPLCRCIQMCWSIFVLTRREKRPMVGNVKKQWMMNRPTFDFPRRKTIRWEALFCLPMRWYLETNASQCTIPSVP